MVKYPRKIPVHTEEIGCDEAGRGCLAGPLVAAAVYLPEGFDTAGIRDSKLLTAQQRERIFERIMAASASGQALVGVGIASVEMIDKVNVLQATMRAMHFALHELQMCRAAATLSAKGHKILVDGNYFHSTEYTNFTTIVRGDELHDCIAAASIVAKVTRDHWMRDVADRDFPHYGFKQHKGYATKQHREAILRHGTCVLHRSLFVRNILAQRGEQ
jgi:ribonuclease HII